MPKTKAIQVPPPSALFPSHAEWACLWALMSPVVEQRQKDWVLQNLGEDDFGDSDAKTLFAAIYHLLRRGAAVDLLTAWDQLELEVDPDLRTRMLNKVTDLPGVANPFAIQDYAVLVKEASIRRRLWTSTEAAMAGLIPSPLPDLSKLGAELARLRSAGAGFISMDVVAQEVSERLERIEKQESGAIPYGLPPLDRVLDGTERGDLITVGGRTSMGKTALLLTLALAQAKAGYSVAFWSGEQPQIVVTMRLLSQVSSIPYRDIRRGEVGRVDPAAPARYASAKEILAGLPIVLSCSAASTATLRGWIETLPTQPDILFVDYLGLLTDPTKENETLRLGAISKALKAIAKDFNMVVFAAHQLSRGVEIRADKRPSLADLRQSGHIEEDSDVVALVYRPGYYESPASRNQSGDAELVIAKNRNGPTGIVEIHFHAPTMRFTKREAEDVYPRGQD